MAFFWGFRFAAALACVAPLRLAYAVGRLLGTLAYYAWPAGRRSCITNMRHVLDGDEAKARVAARRSFANYGLYIVDFLRFGGTSAAELGMRMDYNGWETLAHEREQHGVLFVTMHVGNWDVAAAAFAHHGIPLSVVADTFGNTRLNTLVRDSRRHLGVRILPAERIGPSILRALRNRDVVAILIDVPPTGAGVAVEFFGGTIAVPDGPARIALRTGATVIASTLPRAHPRSERVVAETEVVRFTPTGDGEQDVRALTQAIMRALEPMVHRCPEQWYIFRSLWVADYGRA